MSSFLRTIFNTTGSTLIELLIATMVTGLVVTAVAAMATYSVKNTGESSYKSAATTLAQDVIELARNDRDGRGFIAFKSDAAAGIYCFNTLPNSFAALPSQGDCGSNTFVFAGATFQRELVIVQAVDSVRLEVTVSWQDGTINRSTELIQVLKNSQP